MVFIGKMLPQKIMLAAIPIDGYKSRQHLHIGTGNIPSGRSGRQSILPEGKILHFCACFYGKACCSVMAHGIDTVGIDPRRATRCHYYITAAESHKLFLVFTKKSADPVVGLQQFYCLMTVKYFYAESFGFFLQGLGHKF